MNDIDAIIADAQSRVLTFRIRSSAALTSFLHLASNRDPQFSERELYEAALTKGLYAHLGVCYQVKLDAVTESAWNAILSGLIQSADDLRSYLHCAATTVDGVHDAENVAEHLLIDARRAHLFTLLPAELPKCASESLDLEGVEVSPMSFSDAA